MNEDEIAVFNLYKQLLKSWNEQKADNYGALFTDDASVIGFDGSPMNGRYELPKRCAPSLQVTTLIIMFQNCVKLDF